MPPNPQNLKPAWKKGQSGNPKGRPKLPDIRDALAKVLADEKDGITALEATLAALRAKAVRGDVRAAEVLLDRAFGKSAQTMDVTSAGEKIVTPPIVWSDAVGS
jgi:alkylation response protein AidB-like acyl-CoA dehydrogenase